MTQMVLSIKLALLQSDERMSRFLTRERKKNHCSKCSYYGKEIRLHYNEMERHRTVLSRKMSFFEAMFSLFPGFDLGKRSLKRRGFYAMDYHKSYFHHCNHVEGNRAPYFHNHIVPNAHEVWRMIYDHSLATWSIGESFGNIAEDTREHFVSFFNSPNHETWPWKMAIIIRKVAIF